MAPVPDYTIYLHTDGESVPSFRVCECVDDAAALHAARTELAYSRTAQWAEIRLGERAIGSVSA